MPDIFYNLLGAVLMLAFGLVDVAILGRVLYPALRARREKARLHGRAAVSPRLIMMAAWLANVAVLPAVGFLFLGPALAGLFGQ